MRGRGLNVVEGLGERWGHYGNNFPFSPDFGHL